MTQRLSAYPPSPTFSDPAFSAQYDSAFPANMDLSKSSQHPLNGYPFPAPPGTSAPQYSSRHIPSYPNLVPPNFSRGSYPAVQGGEDPTTFLDLDLSQPGPSTYHQQQPQPQSAAHHYHQPDHEYVQSDAEDDESLVQVKEEQDERQEGEEQDADVDNEEPLYVNAKQYHRILKRRMARARLEELNRLVRSRKPYLHESRHRHACSRPRGKGGRFLTAEEIETLKRQEAEKASKGEDEAQASA